MINITEANFEAEVIKSSVPVVLEFSADWCTPCKAMEPMFESFAKAHPEYKVCKVDSEEQAELAKKYKVRGLPTIMIFKDGKHVQSFTGTLTETKLADLLSKV